MTTTTPTTELEAVNAMLATIGESPVNSLNQAGLTDALLAQTILGNVCREVQTLGWQFNCEYEFPLACAVGDGSVSLPPNVVQVTIAKSMQSDWDVAWRGGKLYDRKNQTFNIGKTLKVDMTVLLTFEDMPQAARWYVTIRAARMFLDRTVGNADLHGFTAKDEEVALAALEEAEGETEDYNILTGSYSVFRVLDRGYFNSNSIIIQ